MNEKYGFECNSADGLLLRASTSAQVDLTELSMEPKVMMGHPDFKATGRFQGAPSRPELTT
jgi:hypothetical protein